MAWFDVLASILSNEEQIGVLWSAGCMYCHDTVVC